MSLVLLFGGGTPTQYLDDAGTVVSTTTGTGSTGQTLIHEGHNPTTLDAVHDAILTAIASGSIVSAIPGQFPSTYQTVSGSGASLDALPGSAYASQAVDGSGIACSADAGTGAGSHGLQDSGCQGDTSSGTYSIVCAIDAPGIDAGILPGAADASLGLTDTGAETSASYGVAVVEVTGGAAYLDASGIQTTTGYGTATVEIQTLQGGGTGRLRPGAYWLPGDYQPFVGPRSQALEAAGITLHTDHGVGLASAADDDAALLALISALY